MNAPRQLAEVRDYDDLHRALRARADELAISRETIDAISGLTPGHSNKLLAPVPFRNLGRVSLGPTLGALGLMLLLVEDAEAMAKYKSRQVARQANQVRACPASIESQIAKKLKKLAVLGGHARAAALSLEKRRRIASRAARARWKARRRAVRAVGAV